MKRYQCPGCDYVVPWQGLTWDQETQHGKCPTGHAVWRIRDTDHVSGYSYWFLTDFIMVITEG
jgi:hypothetical protein